MIRRPPRSTLSSSSAASDVYKRQVGVIPEAGEGTVVSPVDGTVISVAKTGHAYGIKTADGIEILVHIGIDTVKMKGEGFEPLVDKKEEVTEGTELARVNFAAVKAAGFDPTVITTVVNTKAMAGVADVADGTVGAGDPVLLPCLLYTSPSPRD